ncbi:glycosyltransferase [Rhizobium sp.]|uniref:glycosyltransferase n=1 Tax=Rhizobium sp. TaxID=391 RepID=UPI0028A2265D
MKNSIAMAWKFFKKAYHSAPGPSLKEQYQRVLDTYKSNPAEENAKALQTLIGTSSRAADVIIAMDREFDPAFYLAVNSDVRASGIDPAYHYLLWGWKENRVPSRFFDPTFYMRQNSDLASDEMPLAHYATTGRTNSSAPNAISGEFWFAPYAPTESEWNSVSPALRCSTTKAVVILPVYKGLEETLYAIYAALQARNSEEYSLLVINDKSPDPILSQKLRELARKGLFDYHDSDVNRGFVKTINYGISQLSGDLDVVLLNSDAYVSAGWFNRLIAHAERDPKVATITPLSNNATICSYPIYDNDNYHALEVSHNKLDEIAAVANQGLSVETPTGVGFCFFMRRSAISALGYLDDVSFLVGYGEENDFCMRALNAGLKNLIVGDVFVFHTGSVSFSSIKEENYARGQANLERKHPNYGLLVQSHVKSDPERFLRRNIDAARLKEKYLGAVIIVTHKWAGGIETYLRDYCCDLEQSGRNCIILRVHDLHYATIEDPSEKALFLPNLANLDLRTEWDFLTDLVSQLHPSLIQINSFAGLDWFWHRRILEHISDTGNEVSYVGHDYSPISHHYQLLRPDNIYDGVPDLAKLKSWGTMKDSTGSADVCPPAERADVYGRFFQQDVKVTVPSGAARDIYKLFYPATNIEVVPHADHLPETAVALRRVPDGKLRIAVVGAIGPHKGSGVLAALAGYAQARALAVEYYLIGYSNNDAQLVDCGVKVSGRYDSEAAALKKLDELQPDLLMIPSIWPETFCYTLSMAIKKRIPPVVFDIGAQAERVDELGWGATLPISLSLHPEKLSETLLSLDIDDLWMRANLSTQGMDIIKVVIPVGKTTS